MAHRHECRYCEQIYLCPEDADECFQTYIVCQECWWDHDFRQFMLVCFLAVVALFATVYLFREMKKPAFIPPVSSINRKSTTGENYYENGRKTNQAG